MAVPSQAAGLALSPTVASVVSELATYGPVTSFAVMDAVLARHPEYLTGRRPRLPERPTNTARRDPSEWVQLVQERFDPAARTELHGRLLILGLGLVDPPMGEYLNRTDIGKALQVELREPLNTLLRSSATDQSPTEPAPPLESVPTLKDRPSGVDALGRHVFAEVLAQMVVNNRASDLRGTFFLHIGGPWGAGKSTVLNFLRDELRGRTPPWVVVEFNAWQHQRTGPPWWSLLDEIYRQARQQRPGRAGWRLAVAEKWWRARTIEPPRTLPIFVSAAVLAIAWFSGALEWFIAGIGNWGDQAKSLSAIIGLATTVLSVVGLGQLLRGGSSQAASSFLATSDDPLTTITRHFRELTQWIDGPLALLIDDLDRCRARYVIELLEGMQTLFVDGSAAFVVAADRRWLRTCYEQEYAAFTSVGDIGRPLGYLFLDKIFQLSADVPLLTEVDRARYWRGLLRVGPAQEADFTAQRAAARSRLATLRTESDVLRELDTVAGARTPEAAALRQEAALRLATPELQARTEHTLEPLAPLLEANPRAMKRFVNRYGVERLVRTLEGNTVGRELALWTVVLLRWPLLAEVLEVQPQLADPLASADRDGGALPEPILGAARRAGIDTLFTDAAVAAVFGGLDGVILDADALRRCLREPSGESARTTSGARASV